MACHPNLRRTRPILRWQLQSALIATSQTDRQRPARHDAPYIIVYRHHHSYLRGTFADLFIHLSEAWRQYFRIFPYIPLAVLAMLGMVGYFTGHGRGLCGYNIEPGRA